MQGTEVMLTPKGKKKFLQNAFTSKQTKSIIMKLIPHLHLRAGCEHLGQHHRPNTRKKPTLQKS